MSRLERTPRAELDLLQVWVYVAERNFPAAEKLLARIEATVELLAKQPMMGERIDRISPGLRRFSVGEYVVAYRPLEDGIRLLRVVHGSRDFQRLIEEGGDDGR
jgi:toxin ParE1/3/4